MLGTLLLCLSLGFLGYQGIHLYEAHGQCLRTQLENEYLLRNPLCADPWQRRLHGPKQDQVCQRAATENGVHPLACAWKHTWDQIGVMRLWLTVTESYWLLFGIITPTCCMVVIMFFWSWSQSSALKASQQMQRDVLGTLRDFRDFHRDPRDLQVPAIKEQKKKHKRAKVYQLVAEPSYWSQQQQQQQQERPRVELLNI